MTKPMCAATFCPLIAPDGSPWTGNKYTPCKEECGWYHDNKCMGGSESYGAIAEVLQHGKTLNVNPKGRKYHKRKPMDYDCKHTHECKWQIQAGEGKLCPPRAALKEGVDPRVCLF